MSREHCNIKGRIFKHITERQRYEIEVLLKEKVETNRIALLLGKHKRTIEREIQRGTVVLLNSDLTYRDEYCADVAQREYLRKSSNKGACLKIGSDHKLARHIEQRIKKDKYSPGAVIGEIKVKGINFSTEISIKTLYNYIDKGIFAKISNKDLVVKRNVKKTKSKRSRIAHKNLKGTSIEERPAHIDERIEHGNWEMDCVVGKKGSKSALLVLTERVTREEIIRKIPAKTQAAVQKEIDKMERKLGRNFYERFKTITVDNGSEFLDWAGLERSTNKPGHSRFKIYYAHPYSSWERGSNENANKLIRRFVPKGTDMGKLTHRDVKRIEEWINNYPRKIHGYRSANEMAA